MFLCGSYVLSRGRAVLEMLRKNLGKNSKKRKEKKNKNNNLLGVVKTFCDWFL